MSKNDGLKRSSIPTYVMIDARKLKELRMQAIGNLQLFIQRTRGLEYATFWRWEEAANQNKNESGTIRVKSTYIPLLIEAFNNVSFSDHYETSARKRPVTEEDFVVDHKYMEAFREAQKESI